MKHYLIILFLLTSSMVKPCGYEPDYDNFFYNLLNQENISAQAYYPFLRTHKAAFNHPEKENPYAFSSGNLTLWKELLPIWNNKNIKLALETNSDEDFEKLWVNKNSTIEQSAKKYMKFARKCSQLFAYRNTNAWNYDEIIASTKIDIVPLLEEGMRLVNNENNTQLKLRYYYQLIRALHYDKQTEEAVNLFNTQI